MTTDAATGGPAEDELEAARTLDGNVMAGLLFDVFGAEMTAAQSRCASCGNVGAMATLLAYTGGPGTVLRCSVCRNVVMRVARRGDSFMVDVRGAFWLHVPAGPGA